MRIGYILILLLFAGSTVDAQTTETRVAVQALMAGDYAAAAGLLARGSEQHPPDPLASFFLGMLYQYGRGVPLNQERACELYIQSAATPGNPLATQALGLSQSIYLNTFASSPECSAESLAQVRSRPPVTRPPFVPMTLNQPLTPISEGIAALVAGDYSRAAERLRPFAERFRTFDPTAAFFLGAMYQNGLGLAPDPMRACALFVRASGHEAMIGQYAQDMFQSFNRRIDRHEFLECTLLGNIGLQHRFHPVTFPLGAGHWISIDLHGATVTYEGVEKHVELGLDLSGIVYVSIDHTPLTAERTAVPRHFIEVFAWVPAENNWVLQWRVFEVVRQQMIAIDTPIVMTSDAEEPPDQLAFDLHAVAHLRVNMRGDVEWVLATGPKEQFAVIPSDADRQQSAERARAQKAADAQVDWSRTVDVDRTPQLSYSRSIGCGASNSDRTEAITFWLVTSGLNLNVTQTFDLRTAEAIGLAVHVFDRAIRDDRWPFCTDTGAPAVGHKIWKPIAGNVTVEFSRPEAVNSEETWVRLKLVVTGAEFMNEAGVRVKQTQPITLSGGVTRSR